MKKDANISEVKMNHATNKQDIHTITSQKCGTYILCHTPPPRQDILHILFKELENKPPFLASYFSGKKYMN